MHDERACVVDSVDHVRVGWGKLLILTFRIQVTPSLAEICGGGNRDSIYAKRDIEVIAPAAPQRTGLPGLWQYKGCLMDQDVKSLPEKIVYTGTNTGNKCLKACSDYGYNAAGMEYGEECYCGDKSDPAKQGAKLVAETDCNTPCPGDAR